jgi:putative ABC transport system permease protein
MAYLIGLWTAVLPGVALQELWSLVGVAETALIIVSALVVATALLGMLIAILSTLNERRREMAILRSVGPDRSMSLACWLPRRLSLRLSEWWRGSGCFTPA